MSEPQWRVEHNRRTFLKTMAAMGAAWSVSGCGGGEPAQEAATAAADSAAAPAAWRDRIGVQLYTVRDQMERDFIGTLERVAQIGYREVEFAGYFDRSPEEVRQLLDRLGLRAPSTHVDLALLRSDLPGQLQTARTVGHEYITVPALGEAFSGGTMDLAFWQRTAQEFNQIATAAREQGVSFAYHNHWFEFEPLADGRTGWDVLLAETDPSLVKFELDLFWTIFSGLDPLQLFQASPGRYPMWHVKDMRDVQTGRGAARGVTGLEEIMGAAMPRLAAVGEGEVDFRSIFARAEQAGLQHFFVENDAAPEGDSLANIQTSYQNLSGLLA